MINCITDVDESFFLETKKIFDNYKNISDIRLVGSMLRNKKRVGDFDVAVLFKDNTDNIAEIKDNILNLREDYYPKIDVLFWKHKIYDSILNKLVTLNKSSYDELKTYPYFSVKEKKYVNFEKNKNFEPYKISPFRFFMVPACIIVKNNLTNIYSYG